MFRILILAFILSAGSAAAQDSSDISARIARDGLAATADSLSGAASASDRFALGGVLFLRAIEKTLQTRWRYGIERTGSILPVLRLPIGANPAPEPFRPELVGEIFATLIDDMTAARAPLDGIADADAVGLRIALDDLWFDINMNGLRDADEGLLHVAGATLRIGSRRGAGGAPVIRFDTADTAWLSAYTHFLSALGDLVLAFDPTPQIRRVGEASAAMARLGAGTPFSNAYDMMLGAEIDMATMIYLALQQPPDPIRTRSLRSHLLAMIGDNRRFWARLTAETDNDAEWIPNATQNSALGIDMPADTGAVWIALLGDAEDVLEGRKLIPFWRLRSGAGINLKRLLQDPPAVDVGEWIQGVGLLPYFEDGERISPDNWWRFRRMMRGNAALFAAWLN